MTATLRACAPGKVNLSLFLGPTRADGRHELVTLFESLTLADELTLSVLPDGSPDEVVCPGVEGENLAARAIAALRARRWAGPPVRITIDKRVPVAAGMGGGSADAAAALRLDAEVSPLPPATRLEVATELGADVPSQLAPGLWLGTGAGEVLWEFAPLAAHALVVLPLPHALATPAVYAEADRLELGRTAGDLVALRERLAALGAGAVPPADLLVNDLEPAAVALCPAVGEALAAMRSAGAENTLVCGSGPTVAGVFWGTAAAGAAERACTRLRGSYPGALVARPVRSPE
jgi:4-diphosphocytidyl-2-C-methyl-D-erythritol kinase